MKDRRYEEGMEIWWDVLFRTVVLDFRNSVVSDLDAQCSVWPANGKATQLAVFI